MRVIPVIDVMSGQVVRAVAGRRDQYRPIRSRLTHSTDPIEVATSLLDTTRAGELYVADLDAVTGQTQISPFVGELVDALDCLVWLDAGLSDTKGEEVLPDSPRLHPIVGTETAGWKVLAEITAGRFAGRVTLSIDLRGGELLGDWKVWNLRDSWDAVGLARRAADLGIGTFIALDLARVGVRAGPGTEALCAAIRRELPNVRLFAGGGVRDGVDVKRLADAGADGVLVASALHDGTLEGLPGRS